MASERPTLDAAALYGPAGELAKLVGPHTEADPVALLMSALTAFGNCAGRSRYVRADGVAHYPNLFCVAAGSTSKSRKGTSWARGGRELFEAVDPNWMRTNVRGGLSTGEGLIYAVRDAVEGTAPVKAGGKFTGESQTFIADPGVLDKRVLCLEAEFSSVLRRAQRQENTLSELIRRAWETGDLQTLTKNSPMRATGAHVSIFGHITVDELREALDSIAIANGFANRIIWILVHRARLLPFSSEPDRIKFEAIAAKFRRALDHARRPGLMQFSEAACDIWRTAYSDLSSDRPGLTGAILARSEAQVLRLSLVFALLDGADRIEPEPLLAALALWRYCEASVDCIWQDATGNRDADAIAGALRARNDGMTRSEISNIFGRNICASRIDRALSLLAKLARATVVLERTSGRPAERWKVIGQKPADEKPIPQQESQNERSAPDFGDH